MSCHSRDITLRRALLLDPMEKHTNKDPVWVSQQPGTRFVAWMDQPHLRKSPGINYMSFKMPHLFTSARDGAFFDFPSLMTSLDFPCTKPSSAASGGQSVTSSDRGGGDWRILFSLWNMSSESDGDEASCWVVTTGEPVFIG